MEISGSWIGSGSRFEQILDPIFGKVGLKVGFNLDQIENSNNTNGSFKCKQNRVMESCG